MILRRFMSHVTDQNWFAVGLDVIVVITGIFLGMQVTDWNEERKNQYEFRLLVDRMANEAADGIRAVDDYLVLHSLIIDRSSKFISSLNKPQPCGLTNEAMSLGVIAITSFPPLKFDLMVLDELVQSGRVDLIRDDDFRLELARTRSNLTLIKEQWTRYYQSKGATERVIFPALGLDLSKVDNFDLADQSLAGMSFNRPEALCANDAIIGQMSGTQAAHIAYLAYVFELRAALGNWQAIVESYRKG